MNIGTINATMNDINTKITLIMSDNLKNLKVNGTVPISFSSKIADGM